jgi:hypothetical protein
LKNAKVGHTQNIGNGIGLVATQIVNGVADAMGGVSIIPDYDGEHNIEIN